MPSNATVEIGIAHSAFLRSPDSSQISGCQARGESAGALAGILPFGVIALVIVEVQAFDAFGAGAEFCGQLAEDGA